MAFSTPSALPEGICQALAPEIASMAIIFSFILAPALGPDTYHSRPRMNEEINARALLSSNLHDAKHHQSTSLERWLRPVRSIAYDGQWEEQRWTAEHRGCDYVIN